MFVLERHVLFDQLTHLTTLALSLPPQDPEKVQAADPDDWNSSDWSGMSSVKKKASVRGVRIWFSGRQNV